MDYVSEQTLSLLSSALHGRDFEINPNEFPDIFKELKAQSVVAIPAEIISKSNLPLEVQMEYLKHVAKNVQQYHQIVEAQNEIVNALGEKGINSAVLKGTAAAKYYPHPEYRTMGDIDILVNPMDFDKARCVFDLLGLTISHESEMFTRHKSYVNSCGLEIELHQFFSSVGSSECRGYLDDALYSDLNTCDNHILKEVPNGLVLIGHVAQHLRSGLGLRQIIDWMMYVEANLTDEFWDKEFFTPVKECGFDKLAKVTTAVCRKYLGLSLDITWCNDIDDGLIDSFMEYIMDQGNFGRKHDHSERKASTVLNNLRNPIVLFKYLQAGGKSHWKLARENKFFGCFAWIYQIGHIIKMGLTRKIGLKQLKDSHEESNIVVKLMDDLNITNY